uniref:Mycolic acid cyclopropane synthetase n=1 Tax=Pithovirus LCPAC304 TaxID=2506594 RepID=A0A481Z7T9_9VIRU|nr:MAG: mycolic acid cyclopropane synthetase [Pithovirus LCPAC304]
MPSKMSTAKAIVCEIGEAFDIDTSSIAVYDERVYDRLLKDRNLGMGESYMEGWWDCKRLDDFICQVQRKQIGPKIQWGWWTWIRWGALYSWSWVFNLQSYDKSLEVGASHYDLGEELYGTMLDSRMMYSCGYWKDATTLDLAQEAKCELICQKLGLKEGMTVLDIGCGWGGFAKYAADTYSVQVIGITISNNQLQYARNHNKTDLTTFHFMDYRRMLGLPRYEGYFDRVVSIGMLEHVGAQNYDIFMETVDYVLKAEGLALLHTIGGRQPKLLADAWFNKYIFPNSVLPTLTQISKSVEKVPGNPFVIEDIHNFGSHYDKTLLCWYQNFMDGLGEINKKRTKAWKERLDETFVRMWRYYLLCSAGMFRSRDIQLYQVVLSKGGVEGGYQSIR